MGKPEIFKYWSLPYSTVLQELKTIEAGLTEEEAASRLKEYGKNSIKRQQKTAPLALFLNQFKNSIILIMLVATLISALTGDVIDSLIILAIVSASAVLSFVQEYSASKVMDALRSRIQITTTVMRSGKPVEIPTAMIVPGDIVLLSAGSIIPADGLVTAYDSFHVDQSALTGESFVVEKYTGVVPADSDLARRTNCVFMGTYVRSGNATMLVVKTGIMTEFGQIAEELSKRRPETEFARGVRRFGNMLSAVMLSITFIIFALNLLLRKPFVDSLLFSVALVVGITPQLLPAIINITLSRGAQIMAKAGVIVRRLTALENFGSMDVLCTDKTGTLTQGVIHLDGALDADSQDSVEAFRLAYLNSKYHAGMVNELDKAILSSKEPEIEAVKKLGEIPFDFERKRLSVIMLDGGETKLITKGAVGRILETCDKYLIASTERDLDAGALDDINMRVAEWSSHGYRVVGVAKKLMIVKERYAVQDEASMTLVGFLLFLDPLKPGVKKAIRDLGKLGVKIRIITGDSRLVALQIASKAGLHSEKVVTGTELEIMSEETLANAVETTDIFAEVNPGQKERIVLALKKNSHVVGYMGDGINDAPALHASDVSISINTAVDVAKESADFVLRKKSLTVLKRGIELGRAVFTNTLKYINVTTSANFGNMFSMACASLFLPYLPLLPKQILLINFISDFPSMTIAGDSVDAEMISSPHKWDIKSIRNFMLTFGFISSAFDYLTFAILLLVFREQESLFQSGWFVLSILTELLALLIMRTRKPFFRSKPAPILLYSSIIVGIITLSLPYLPLQQTFGIIPIPPLTLLALFGVAILYVVTTEIAKHFYYLVKLDK